MASTDITEGIEKGAMEEHEFKESDKETALIASEGKNAANDDSEKKEKSDQDVVFIQDTGFTVKVVAPSLEPFDIQVSQLIMFQPIPKHNLNAGGYWITDQAVQR